MPARLVAVGVVALLFHAAPAASQPIRRLDAMDRAAVLAMIAAVDAAQSNDAPAAFTWDHHVLKSVDATAFVPFRVQAPDALRSSKSTLMYVRAVSRHDGIASTEERSFVRDELLNGALQPREHQEPIFLGTGEMPVGGPATSSSRAVTQAAAEASARLAMQQRVHEKEKAAAEAAKKKAEVKERDPFRFPFEEFYSVGSGPLDRALGLPAGEYDVYVALVDRRRLKTEPPVVAHQRIAIPDLWNDELALSSLIFAADVRTLAAPLSRQEQASHPYTFGHAQVVPVATPEFSQKDVLTIVYQICNYGAPDTDLSANYAFYRVDGGRTLFNRTAPQTLGDEDLPPPANVWDTAAFTMQSVPLQTFPPGAYEVEVTVRDNHTRATAAKTARFVVKP